jgi:hypothetical protein
VLLWETRLLSTVTVAVAVVTCADLVIVLVTVVLVLGAVLMFVEPAHGSSLREFE